MRRDDAPWRIPLASCTVVLPQRDATQQASVVCRRATYAKRRPKKSASSSPRSGSWVLATSICSACGTASLGWKSTRQVSTTAKITNGRCAPEIVSGSYRTLRTLKDQAHIKVEQPKKERG